MKNVTYLIGAGASAGKRGKDLPGGDPKDNSIYEGLPCVNEISNCLWNICNLLDKNAIPKDIDWKDPQIGLASFEDWEHARKELWRRLYRLYIECDRHATIDTYAKKLVLKKRPEEFKQLEQLLTLFFLYLQLQNYPDSRYDTFFANILEPNLHFPSNIRVISWNYDSQFELAYSGYDEQGELLVGYKNAMFDADYEIIKINGTATFAKQTSIVTLRKKIRDKLFAIKEEPHRSEQLQREQTWLLEFIYLYQLYVVGKKDNTHFHQPGDHCCQGCSSYAHGRRAQFAINQHIVQESVQTQGGSAGNQRLDRLLCEAVLTKEQSQVQIVEIDRTEQFYLPPEL